MNCPKCNSNGEYPLKRKDGSIVPFAWVNCEDCYKKPKEHYIPLSVSDWDFSCSDTFRVHSYQYCNQADLGYAPPEPEAPEPQVIEHRHSNMSKKDFAKLQNLEGQVKYLQGKLTEREQKKEDYY